MKSHSHDVLGKSRIFRKSRITFFKEVAKNGCVCYNKQMDSSEHFKIAEIGPRKDVDMLNRLNTLFKQQNTAPHQQFATFLALMFVGGYFGAFTYLLRGGVFCSAQTVNMLLCAVNLVRGKPSVAATYLIPILAFASGTVFAEALPKQHRSIWGCSRRTWLILLEIFVVVFLGCLPESAPFQITQISINFISAVQYNSFHALKGQAMATTFCSNHLSQTFSLLIMGVKGDKSALKNSFRHLAIILFFMLGAATSAVIGGRLLGKSIFCTLAVLVPLYFLLLRHDLSKHTKH